MTKVVVEKKVTRADHRAKAREAVYADLEKEFGAGTGRPLPERKPIPMERFSTGSMFFDRALGGGVPRGRIVEFFGQESSGKTTLALSTLAQVLRTPSAYCAFIDAEQSFDEAWATKLGVDVSRLSFHQPTTGEEALTITDKLVKSEAFDLIVVDSVSALVPKAELEGDMGQAHMGLQARLMSQGLRKLTGNVARSNCTVIFINQLREKIGVVYGNPEVTTGGRALRYWASVRVALRNGEPIKLGEKRIGDTIRARVVKNKTARPHQTAEMSLLYETGLDLVGEIIDVGADAGIITKSGSHYTYNDKKIGQGRDTAIEWYRALPGEQQDSIREKIQHVLQTGEVA